MNLQMQAMDTLYIESKRVLTNLVTMRENSEKEFKIIETSKISMEIALFQELLVIKCTEVTYKTQLLKNTEFLSHILNEL